MTEKSRDFAAALAALIVVALLLSLFSPVRLIRQGSEALETALVALREQREPQSMSAPADPAQMAGDGAAQVERPARSAGDWITNDDYPVEALRNNWQGRVTIRWTIDESGRARDCVIVESSGHAVLDEASCRLVVARARYFPALDRDGRPVPSTDQRRIIWRLPE